MSKKPYPGQVSQKLKQVYNKYCVFMMDYVYNNGVDMSTRILRSLIIIVLLLSFTSAVMPQDDSTSAANILTWIEAGSSPRESSPSTAGELGLMDGTGTFTVLQEVPPQTSTVQPCGDESTSPDGSLFAFYMGLDTGGLYVMNGAESPVLLDDVGALTCLGWGTFQFSPDGSRMAYIAYESDAAASEFADGFLHIVNTADLTDEALFENVISFDIGDEGAGFVSFYTNDRNEADEAAVFWWNGSAEREVATLRPDENCRYTSASISATPDGNLVLLMGHRCLSGDTRTSWQFYMVDVAARSATLAASEFQDGQFASFARTNQIKLLPDGTSALFTVPDGVTANTASLMTISLGDYATSEIVERQAVFPNLGGTHNVGPRLSPDGRWMAFVVTSPNNDNTLNVIDMDDPAAPPITVSAGSRNDVISDMVFSANNQRLIFIAGSPDTGRNADNSLIAIDLENGSDFRIKRGRFAPGLAVAPDGSRVVAMDYQVLEDERQPPYLNLVEINVDTSETILLFEGAEIVEGEVTNQQFALPVSWRP